MKITFAKMDSKNSPVFLLFLQRYCSRLSLAVLFILIILLFGSPVSAAIEGFVAISSDGSYHQYSYTELLDSYAMKLLGKPDGLYDDYAVKNPFAFLDSINGYIDYDETVDQYALALLNGQDFNLNRYVESGKAKKAGMPGMLKVVSLADNEIVRIARNINQDLSPDPTEVPTITQPVSNPSTYTPLVATARVTLTRARQWAAERGAHRRFIDVAPLYWEYAGKTGLCPAVLYAQSALETNFGYYTGIVPPEYNNWAGLKTANASGDEPEDHEQFAAPEEGVRAHFNHMAAYTGLSPIGIPHGRYHVVLKLPWAGKVTTVEELSGKWAPSASYHERIIVYLEEMK